MIDQAVRMADAALRREGATVEWNRLPWSSAYYEPRSLHAPACDPLLSYDAVLVRRSQQENLTAPLAQDDIEMVKYIAAQDTEVGR